MKANTVAVVSDGSAVLGLATLVLWAAAARYGSARAVWLGVWWRECCALCLGHIADVGRNRRNRKALAPSFGGINLKIPRLAASKSSAA